MRAPRRVVATRLPHDAVIATAEAFKPPQPGMSAVICNVRHVTVLAADVFV